MKVPAGLLISSVAALGLLIVLGLLIASAANVDLDLRSITHKQTTINVTEVEADCRLIEQLQFDLNNVIQANRYCSMDTDCMLLKERTAINERGLSSVREKQELLIAYEENSLCGPKAMTRPAKPMITPAAQCKDSYCVAIDLGVPKGAEQIF